MRIYAFVSFYNLLVKTITSKIKCHSKFPINSAWRQELINQSLYQASKSMELHIIDII